MMSGNAALLPDLLLAVVR